MAVGRKGAGKPAGAVKAAAARIPLYVDGLDEHMEGGVPAGNVVLVCGVSGTMKSSLCFNVLFNEALRGKSGLYFTLEQNSESFIAHLNSLGYDLSKVDLIVVSNSSELNSNISRLKSKKSTIVLADLSAMRKSVLKRMDNIGDSTFVSMVRNFITRLKEVGCELFVLDSLTAFYILASFENKRKDLFSFFSFLRDSGITSFLISEMPLQRDRYGEYRIEDFLVDGVVMVDLVARQRKVTREIQIVKMRATRHTTDVFSLEFSKGKFSALYGGQPPLI